MKLIRSIFGGLLILGGFVVLLNLLHAQEADSAVSIQVEPLSLTGRDVATFSTLSEAQLAALVSSLEATPVIPFADLSPAQTIGNFYSLQNPDWPPLPADLHRSDVWPLSNGSYLLNDVTVNYQSPVTRSLAVGGMQAMSLDLPAPDDGDTNGSGGNGFNLAASFPTNGLWLELTNYVNGTALVNLHNATNQVYAIWSTTNLPGNWQVETEVWPTDTNCTPFTAAALNRDTLFLRAEDWTGVTSNGNTTPDWWFWKYFGTTALTDTNLDANGNTLLSDYQNGVDPNVISFTVRLGNQHFNTTNATGSYLVLGGVPSYEAVLVNDDDFSNAVWQPYDGTVHLNPGPTDGVYQVMTALKGRAPDATPTWVGTTVYLDQTAPVLTITHPAGGTVALPYIQLQGLANERLAGVTYDLSNALGMVTGQPGSVTGEFLDPNSLAFTTNYFQCYDVWLTNGLNVITVHATDLAGNTGSTNVSYNLDYSSKTNPPVIMLDWPQDGMQLDQSNLTVRGELSDPTASISLQVTDDLGDTNIIAGVVERDGHFWIQNVPLTGTEAVLTLTAQDVVSNTATMNLTLFPDADAGLSISPVTGDLWESTATVNGTIGDDSYVVTVNGVPATNNGDGTWTAYGVPVSGGNVAVFNAVASPAGEGDRLARSGNLAGFNSLAEPDDAGGGEVNVQAATVKPAALKLAAATWSDELGSFEVDAETLFWFDDLTTWNWSAGKGGSYAEADNTDYQNADGSTGSDSSGAYAPIQADRSVPYLHSWSSTGPDIYVTNPFVGAFGWQGDFPQEVGGLQVVNSQNPDYWENRSGSASWVLHAGALSVAGNQESLMVLTGGATEEVGAGVAGGGRIANGPDVPGPEINNTVGTEDANDSVYLTMSDGTDKTSTLTTDRPLAKVGNGPAQYKLVSWTHYLALTDTNRSRTSLGVGEEVDLGFIPTPWFALDWTTSGGSLSTTLGAGTTLTAPSNATPSVTVTATVRGGISVKFPPFNVVEPAGIDHAKITGTNHYSIGVAGVGMQTSAWIAPTSVSFYRVSIMEVGEDASSISGYFTQWTPQQLHHNTADFWFGLNAENQFQDNAYLSLNSSTWSDGSYTWDIPAKWQITGSGVTNSISGWNQIFSIDASGTMTVQKFGHSATRTTNDVITIN